MAEVGGGRMETTPSTVYGKSTFMDIQAGQGQGQGPQHSGAGSPDVVVAGSGFGSPGSAGTGSSSYHHQSVHRPSPPPITGYHHHMHHHHHQQQQQQLDVTGCAGFMASNPSVQVTGHCQPFDAHCLLPYWYSCEASCAIPG